jgi:hypothetical protein
MIWQTIRFLQLFGAHLESQEIDRINEYSSLMTAKAE